MSTKPNIKQKNTWLGVALVGFGIYQIVTGNLTEGVASVTAGLGLVVSVGS
jgi:hypothetical protein